MILVDAAIWPWRGQRWAHLVSDESLDELHAFAAEIGLRRLGFQGDHYDVPASVRDRALAAGAQAVEGREIVARLRASGLRLAPRQRPPRWEIVQDETLSLAQARSRRWPEPLDRAAPLVSGDGQVRLLIVRRPGAAAVALAGSVDLTGPVPEGIITHAGLDDHRPVLELLWGHGV